MARDPEKAKARCAAWYKANLEKAKASRAAYRKANLEKAKARDAARYKANPEKVKARLEAWGKANPDKMKLKENRKNNPGLPDQLLAVIVMQNMIRKEIRNQTNQTK